MTKKSFAYLFLLPLAILLFAVLQYHRVATLLDRAEYEQEILVKAEKLVNHNFTGPTEIEYQREGADKAELIDAGNAQTDASIFLSQNKKRSLLPDRCFIWRTRGSAYPCFIY